MYQRLSLIPIGFPILDDLRLAILTQRATNEWNALVSDAVCAFINQKASRRKGAITASARNIKSFYTDKHGKTTVHYDGGTFDIMFEAVKMRGGIALEVIRVAHINPFAIGIVATVGERAIYEESKK